MSIAVLVPSRSRPDRFAELLESIDATAHGEVAVYCGLDADDPLEWYYPARPAPHTYVHGPRKPLARWADDLAKLAIRDGHAVIGFMGDDHRPRTTGWDKAISSALSDVGGGMAYGRDGLQDERLPTWCFWSAAAISALGYFCPPGQQHLYLDDFWLCLARAAGRCVFLSDVLVEHMHPSAGKASTDALYAESAAKTDADARAWVEYRESSEFSDAVTRVRLALNA